MHTSRAMHRDVFRLRKASLVTCPWPEIPSDIVNRNHYKYTPGTTIYYTGTYYTHSIISHEAPAIVRAISRSSASLRLPLAPAFGTFGGAAALLTPANLYAEPRWRVAAIHRTDQVCFRNTNAFSFALRWRALRRTAIKAVAMVIETPHPEALLTVE